uniref:Chromo domain-containing protein n=1 Tax=Panagrolaimus superbus TaxID=310955 RepID=A0A914ZBU8_9BILA
MAPKFGHKKRKVQYEVEKILDVRGHGSKLEYFIKWKGYKSSDNSWQPASGVSTPKNIPSRKSIVKSTPHRKNVPSAVNIRRSPRLATATTTSTDLPSGSNPAQIPQSSNDNGFTPASDIKDLNFVVKSVKGLHGSNGENVVVYDLKGSQKIVKVKAVVKQNPDVIIRDNSVVIIVNETGSNAFEKYISTVSAAL